MNWIWDNKEWLFSGVGVTILGGFGLFKFFQKKINRSNLKNRRSHRL